jgi:hypothetical protein
VLSGGFSESEDKEFCENFDDGEIAEDYGYCSDSDLEEDWDFEGPVPKKARSQPRQPEALYGHHKEHVRTGKVIKIKDVAFITCVYTNPLFNISPPQLAKVSKFSYFVCTPTWPIWHHLGLRKIANREVVKLRGRRRERYPRHRQNLPTDWRIRF